MEKGYMKEDTYYLTYLVSYYMILFFSTSIVFGKASANIRSGNGYGSGGGIGSGTDIEGFSLPTFNFYIVLNIVLGLVALIFLILLTRRTFSGRPMKSDGRFAFGIIIFFFIGGTIANTVYLGRISQYLTRYPQQTIIGNLGEIRRVNTFPISKTVVDIFWTLNLFSSTFIIFQLAFVLIRFITARTIQKQLLEQQNRCA